MSDEQISALVDDALPGAETPRAVERLLEENGARAAWGRYHLIGAALREAAATGDLAQGDATTRGKVVPFPSPSTPTPRRHLPAAVGLAAAAAVAAFAFAITVVAPRGPHSMAPSVAQAPPAAPAPRMVVLDDDGVAGPINQEFMVQDDKTQQRLNDYVANFNERRARQPMPGVHPYVRIVGFESR